MGSKQQSRIKPVHVAGRYALFDEIASGGMATVHLGRQVGDAGFARTVAIKRMRRGFIEDPKVITMFVDEARLTGRVQHPNVVMTIDVVHHQGELFLIMEYEHGESLKYLTNATGKLVSPPPEISASIVCGALRGLHAAHEAKDENGKPLGTVHRDVSPQNLLVNLDGMTRVVDFGIAKATGRLQSTQTGQLKGKPKYMAPEQLTGKKGLPIDRRTDVFGMAIVLWELLAGRRLFEGAEHLNVLHQVLTKTITSPLEHNPKVPPALALTVMKGLERDPALRHATARDFARAIEAAMPRGIAGQDTVGEWVKSIAGEKLAAVERRILEIERASPSDEREARDVASAKGDAGSRDSRSSVHEVVDTSTNSIITPREEATDTIIDGKRPTSELIRTKTLQMDPPSEEETDHTTAVVEPTSTPHRDSNAESLPPEHPTDFDDEGAYDVTHKMEDREDESPRSSAPSHVDQAALPALPPTSVAPPTSRHVGLEASQRRLVALGVGVLGFLLLLFTLVGTRC